MKRIMTLTTAMVGILAIASCNKVENELLVEQEPVSSSTTLTTKALGDKSPALAVYVETNDTNPLNAGDYYLSDGTPLFDIVELFASNIHKETVNGNVRPTLYLNDKLTNVLENGGTTTYVRPLQDQDQLVVLTTLGNWQGIGVANMTATQANQFATILAWAVVKYGLDGIGFDDEYANYSSTNNTSYSNIITGLKTILPDVFVTVFDYGYTNTISSAAASLIDYAYYCYFGYPSTSSNITGMNAARWAPYCLNLGNSYSTYWVQYYSGQYSNYGAYMCFNLRKSSDKNPLPVLQAMATGAGWGTVSCTNGDRDRDAGSVTGGYTITYDDAVAGLTAAGYSYL